MATATKFRSRWYGALYGAAWNTLPYACDLLSHVPLPKFFRRWRRAWDSEEPGTMMAYEDWYGPALDGLFHAHIESPILGWLDRKIAEAHNAK